MNLINKTIQADWNLKKELPFEKNEEINMNLEIKLEEEKSDWLVSNSQQRKILPFG